MQQGCGPGCATFGAIVVLILLLCACLRPTFAEQQGTTTSGVRVPALRS
jgi:hypothetical protein